jgi:hypothetical protein
VIKTSCTNEPTRFLFCLMCNRLCFIEKLKRSSKKLSPPLISHLLLMILLLSLDTKLVPLSPQIYNKLLNIYIYVRDCLFIFSFYFLLSPLTSTTGPSQF